MAGDRGRRACCEELRGQAAPPRHRGLLRAWQRPDHDAGVLSDGQGEKLLEAAMHRELENLAEEFLANPADRAKFVSEHAAFGEGLNATEKAQELDSALRELDYIENLPTHVAIARAGAKDKRIVELRDIEGVAYVAKQSGDLTIAAKSPEALNDLLKRSQAPDALVINKDLRATTNTWLLHNTDGKAAELAWPALQRLGLSDAQIQKVANLMTPPEQRKEQLSESFKEISGKAKDQLGENAKTFPAQLGDGFYKGPIIAETDHHVLQQIPATNTVAHMKTVFNEPPGVDQDQHVKIPYNDGKAKVIPFTPERPRERTRALSR